MIRYDLMSARALVRNLREVLLEEDGTYGLPSYGHWTDVVAAIQDGLNKGDIMPEHLIALGATSEIDPLRECETDNALTAFCKSIQHEAEHNLKEAQEAA